MSRNTILLLLATLFLHVQVEAQTPVPGNYRENFVEGNKLIEEANWPMALVYFKEAYLVDSTNANINYKMGLCYLNSASQKKNSLRYLRVASKDVVRNYDPFEPGVKKAPENTF